MKTLHTRKGRPRDETRGQVLTYFDLNMPGHTAFALAKRGLWLFSALTGWKPGMKISLSADKRGGETLAKRYREYRQEIRDEIFYEDTLRKHAVQKRLMIHAVCIRYVGISAARPPLSFPNVGVLERGRRKKGHLVK